MATEVESTTENEGTTDNARRPTEEVLMDHLRLRMDGDIETDLRRNYAEEAVLLTGYGIFRGQNGIRKSAEILNGLLSGARFMYRTKLAYGSLAFLEWTAESDTMRVSDGADSYLIVDGRIIAQTIHYSLTSNNF